jgi:AI-2 transport protein TqsA
MSDEASKFLQPAGTTEPRRAEVGTRGDWQPIIIVSACLVGTAAGLFLLRELAPLLRPLVLAVFLAYIVLPIHSRLRKHVSATISIVLIAGVSVALLYLLSAMILGNVLALNDDLPRLVGRARQFVEHVRGLLPTWLLEDPSRRAKPMGSSGTEWLGMAMRGVVNHAAQAFGEAVIVGFYLVFLLIEARRMPERVRIGFSPERADQIFGVFRSINSGMMNYLRIKVLASLMLAVPATFLCWIFGLKFAAMWGLLIFVGNFIPYVGSIVAFVLPVALAFLDLEPVWRPLGLLSLLAVNQFVNNNILEPLLTARAVNLSPTFVLFSLTFWGLTWGIMGMFLAVPLTVMLKTVFENVPITSPLAHLMVGDDHRTEPKSKSPD